MPRKSECSRKSWMQKYRVVDGTGKLKRKFNAVDDTEAKKEFGKIKNESNEKRLKLQRWSFKEKWVRVR